MRKEYSFAPFNVLWCIPYFLAPYFYLTGSEHQLPISLFIYIGSIFAVTKSDYLEYRIKELEDKK